MPKYDPRTIRALIKMARDLGFDEECVLIEGYKSLLPRPSGEPVCAHCPNAGANL